MKIKMDELKEISKRMNELKEKLGIKAFERIEHFIFTLYRKIEDLITSRDIWKRKHDKLKSAIKTGKKSIQKEQGGE